MQHVNQVVPLSTTRIRAGSQEVSRNQDTAKLVNTIFRELQILCTAWKHAIDHNVNSYVADYKRQLLEALVREGVTKWEQVQKGLDGTRSAFLPNVNEFAKQCMGGDEMTGTWGSGAHKLYKPEESLPLLKADPESVSDTRQGLKEMFA